MLKRLQRQIQDLHAAHSVDLALGDIVIETAALLHADVAALYFVNEGKGRYELQAQKGLSSTADCADHFKLGEGLVGLVGERAESITILDLRERGDNIAKEQFGSESLTAFLGVPIFLRGELFGIFVALKLQGKVFSEDETALLMTLGIQLSSPLGQLWSRLQPQNTKQTPKKQLILDGIAGASGVAIGRAVVVYPPADLDAVPDKTISNVPAEIELFETALIAAREEMRVLQQRAKEQLSEAESALFDVYARMLDSRSLMNEIIAEIKLEIWAQAALKRVIRRHVAHFESLEDAYLRERAADFRDLGRRILSHLQQNARQVVSFEKNTILVSEEVSATALIEVPEDCLVGVISGSGSGNSHVAILARAIGVPILMSVTGLPLDQLAGKNLILDGYNGQVYVSPSAALKKEFKQLVAEEKQLDDDLASLRDLPAETKDGKKFRLYVNTGLAVDGGISLSSGAEGVGLYRTELPFMLRDRFPSEEEQRTMYRQLLNAFAPRPVIMRTLDIGGDKVLPYFPFSEENPFLGWRGIRISLDHPDIFLQQLRAMMQASEGLDNLSLMLPMITSLHEVEMARSFIDQAYSEVKEEGYAIKMPKVGLMIEVPAAVYQSYELAKRVDFLSVGSNDLIQYLLAVDRNNPRVAELYNGLHPAVLSALDMVVKAGHKANRPVSICGEMAADPLAIVLLVGMGFDSLSLNARNLARTKWVVRNFNYAEAKALVKEVQGMSDATDIRMHMETVLDEAGMGALIRAGL